MKFEYLVQNISDLLMEPTDSISENKLNQLGKQRWQLIKVVGEEFIFERELLESSDSRSESKYYCTCETPHPWFAYNICLQCKRKLKKEGKINEI